MNYTVIVAEDEELLLNNLVHKIEKADPDFQVIGTAQTGAQALSLVEQTKERSLELDSMLVQFLKQLLKMVQCSVLLHSLL